MSNNIKKVSAFKAPEESPGYLLWHVSLAWRSSIEKTLDDFGLTHPQFVVLTATAWLTEKDEHINQRNISEFVGLDPNTTSQVLRTLEGKGLIKRIRLLNERSKNPTVTQMGLSILQKALPAVERADKIFFNQLTKEELSHLLPAFQLLAKKILRKP